MRSTLPPDTHIAPNTKFTNVYVYWVRADLARIGMIAEFSTLKVNIYSRSPNEQENEYIYIQGDLLWRVELARLRKLYPPVHI
jgi:hypothetical protein